MTRPSAHIVGSGLTAAVAAHELTKAGWDVSMTEAQQRVGGNVMPAQMRGVFYEPDGPHIVHTSHPEAVAWLNEHVQLNDYVHTVKSQTESGLLSWPPQVDELRQLPEWNKIQTELAARPAEPGPANFETYAVGLMGETLYRLFIRDYTTKQWGRPAHELSSSFAPKRIDLRNDGYRPLFRDTLQGWPVGGWEPVFDRLLADVGVFLGRKVDAGFLNASAFTSVLVTCPLDDFFGELPLEWRGIRTEHCYVPDIGGRPVGILPAPVVNYPSLDVPYTRKTETRQMSKQFDSVGTVITEEYPGANARHYPVDDAAGENRRRANELRARLKTEVGPNVHAAGRLATYSYINMDQSIVQGLHAAREMMKDADR